MAWRAAHLAKETTQTSGQTSPTVHYALDGAVPGHKSIAQSMSDGDSFWFVIKDSGDGVIDPEYEIVEGTYISATNKVRPDVVLKSSNGGFPVDWPASGTRDIYITLYADALQDLYDPNLAAGLVVRSGKYSWLTRSMAAQVVSNDLLSWTNADGVLGSPTLNLAYPVVRRSGGTDNQRRITNPIVTGGWDRIDSFSHERRGPNGATDVLFRWTKIADQDYTVEVGRGGALSGMLAQVDVPQWLLVPAYATSENNTAGAIQTDTTVSLTIPATGTWAVSVQGIVHARCTAQGNTATFRLECDRKVGAGSFAPLRGATNHTAEGGGSSLVETLMPVGVFDYRITAAGSYEYRLSISSIGGSVAFEAEAAADGRKHSILVRADRIA